MTTTSRGFRLLQASLALIALPVGATLPPVPVSPPPSQVLEYDAEGSLTLQGQGVRGALLPTRHEYDGLKRRQRTIDARNKPIVMSYTGRDDLTGVTDPRALVTRYERNGLGDVTAVSSPDTGLEAMSFDAAGNVLTRTDSRGVTSSTVRDALGRVTSMSYSQPGKPPQVFNWIYDQTGPGFGHGVGQLTTAAYPGGADRYAYDALGRLTSATQTVEGESVVALKTEWAYDPAGRVARLTYPSGRVVHITRTNGAVTGLAWSADASSSLTPLISGVQQLPSPGADGPLRAWVLHLNGSTLSQERVFDDWGRVVRYPLGGSVRDLTYDAADRIVSFTHYNAVSGAPVTALDQSFAYDEVGRLTAVGTSVGSWAFGYDDTGNRTSSTFTAGGGTQSRVYSIAPSSNRLLGMSNPARTFSHDAAGNTESDVQAGVGYTATHDLSGRIVRIDSAQAGGYRYQTEYAHNTLGLRVLKRPISAQRCVTSPGGATACSMLGAAPVTVYVHDSNGQLLGEYNELGGVMREYVWLQGTLVAVLDGRPASTQVSFVQTDHLGTPRVVIDSAGQQRWSWLAEPFGDSAPVENPIGAGVYRLNLRMPGQYWDLESGLSYNWHRSYDGGVGRYTQADPIGLEGGINVYAYVHGNPVSYADPRGLDPWFSDPSLNHRVDWPVRYAPNSGQPAPAIEAHASCLQRCLGQSLTITSGTSPRPSPTSAHPRGVACDFGCNTNPELCRLPRLTVSDCALYCGFTHGLFHAPPHWHLQVGPGASVPALLPNAPMPLP